MPRRRAEPADRDKPEEPVERQRVDPVLAYSTSLGEMWHGDCLDVLAELEDDSVQLLLTSPPFALVRKKDYGNVPEHEYIEWFLEYAREFKRVIRKDGSIVIDLGGAWMPGQPTKSIYQYRLL